MFNRSRLKNAFRLVFVTGLLVVAAIEPTGILRGIAHREAFLHWRPSSYWREVLREDAKNGEVSEATINEFTSSRSSIQVLKECFLDSEAGVREGALFLFLRNDWTSGREQFLKIALNDPDAHIQLRAAKQLKSADVYARSCAKLEHLAHCDDSDVAWRSHPGTLVV
jgi:hypothetical protein